MADRGALAEAIRTAYTKAIDERRPADAYSDAADAVLALLTSDGTVVEQFGVEAIDPDTHPLGTVYPVRDREQAEGEARKQAEYRGREVLVPVSRTVTTTEWKRFAAAPQSA